MKSKQVIILVGASLILLIGLFVVATVFHLNSGSSSEQKNNLLAQQQTSGLSAPQQKKEDADPVVMCIFQKSGQAALKKSVCESLVECQVGQQYKVATYKECHDFYAKQQKSEPTPTSEEPTPTPEETVTPGPSPTEKPPTPTPTLTVIYTRPTMQPIPTPTGMIDEGCFVSWERYFRQHPVNQPGFVESLGVGEPCK